MKNILVLFITLLSFSCEKSEDYVYYSNPATQETFSRNFNILALVDKKIDILWVIDNSGSMGNIQDNIVANTELFMKAFKENKHIEWKMGLISTDEDQDPFLGFDKLNPFDYTSLDPVATFQSEVNRLGVNGSASEYVFYNVNRMISPPLTSRSTDYSHFFRKDAHLVVIMVTDEEEQSSDKDRILYTATSFYNHLRGFKSDNKIIRFYGAFGLGDMNDCSGSSEYYADSPFEEIINRTSGFAISACEANFGNRLADVGNDIVSLLKSPRLPLNARPKVETLEVLFKGQKLKSGPRSLGGIWFYNRSSSSIDFYNLDFAGGDLKDSDIEVSFDIDDGVDRGQE